MPHEATCSDLQVGKLSLMDVRVFAKITQKERAEWGFKLDSPRFQRQLTISRTEMGSEDPLGHTAAKSHQGAREMTVIAFVQQ
jgi:hypothetical protein